MKNGLIDLTYDELVSAERRGKAPDDAFRRGYEDVARAISRYDPHSIVDECIAILNGTKPRPGPFLEQRPWALMLLVKWTFLHEHYQRRGRPPVGDRFYVLHRKVCELEGAGRYPTEYQAPTLFIRALLHQQAPYQYSLALDGVARQCNLFAASDDHPLGRRFLELTNMTIGDHLVFAYAILGWLKAKEFAVVTCDIFSEFRHGAPREKVSRFLDSIATPLEDIPAWLLGYEGVHDHKASEFVERSPFFERPLIRVKDRYHVVSKHALAYCLNHAAYAILREDDKEWFLGHFTSRFERHVGECLALLGLPYLDENELKDRLPGEGKVVDYLVVNGDMNIFVEAKGVELEQPARTAHRPGDLLNATKNTIQKAVTQAQSCHDRIVALDQTDDLVRVRGRTVSLIVTFQSINIGDGELLRDAIGNEKTERLRRGSRTEHLLPLHSFLFISVAELEQMVTIVREKKATLSEVLETALQEGGQGHTKKFSFAMTMYRWVEHGGVRLPFVDRVRELHNRLEVWAGKSRHSGPGPL